MEQIDLLLLEIEEKMENQLKLAKILTQLEPEELILICLTESWNIMVDIFKNN